MCVCVVVVVVVVVVVNGTDLNGDDSLGIPSNSKTRLMLLFQNGSG